MKKLLVVLMSMVMSLSLIGCGGDSAPATTPANNTPTAEEKLAEEQAKADADYDQLLELVDALEAHADKSAELSALLEKVVAGEAEESALVELYKKLADDSQALLQTVENAKWQTEYYKESVALFTASIKALADGERVLYDASVENDEAKLAEGQKLLDEHNAKLNEFLDSMGV